MFFQLSEELIFPDPTLADSDGLLAIGGDLSTDRLLLAYHNGIFPWFNEGEDILWYSPPERFILFPNEIKVSKSMRQVINSRRFKITHNTAFREVIRNCADAKRGDQHGTWIGKDMQEAYFKLHQKGYAHSIEVWEKQELVGGLYGLVINKVFCGESMFSKKSNASKAALIWLAQNADIRFIDCQLYTDHLASMGAKLVSRAKFLELLQG